MNLSNSFEENFDFWNEFEVKKRGNTVKKAKCVVESTAKKFYDYSESRNFSVAPVVQTESLHRSN